MDDLNTPLGQQPAKPPRIPFGRIAAQAIAGLLGAAAIGFILWAAIAKDQLGGEPTATAAIAPPDSAPARQAAKQDLQAGEQPATPAETPAGKTITIIDGTSGKRQEVVIPDPAGGKRSGGEARLLETSRHGPIPKIAPDGARPSEIYARKTAATKGNADGPQVALIIGGLGVSASATASALSKLPGAVTFAFMPYGGDLDLLIDRARDKGHEVLLQVPMEPHEYPDNDPGPQTLLASLSADQNVDRLHWLFSRMQGYVGIMNFMGARFTASQTAMAPVLREVSRRGLLYVDDGASARSQAGQIAGANNVPFVKADIVLDAVPSAADIDNALKRLEAMARDRGLAVGYASALPASIDRVAKWAKAAEGRGIVLVPVTAVAIKARSS